VCEVDEFTGSTPASRREPARTSSEFQPTWELFRDLRESGRIVLEVGEQADGRFVDPA